MGKKIIATSDDVAINPGLLPHATYTDFAQSGKTIGGGNPSATIFVILHLNVLFILTSIQRNSLYGSCYTWAKVAHKHSSFWPPALACSTAKILVVPVCGHGEEGFVAVGEY